MSDGEKPEVRGLLTDNQAEERIWRESVKALNLVANTDDNSFNITVARDNSKEFEDSVDFLAMAWRMTGSGQKSLAGFDQNRFIELLNEKPKLKFYLTVVVLRNFETEDELRDQGVKFEEVSSTWTEDLVQTLISEVNTLHDLSDIEIERRMSIFVDQFSRSLINIDNMNIDDLLKDSPKYTAKQIGDSYLSLEQVERVAKALLLQLDTGTVELSAKAANDLETIRSLISKLDTRRSNNENLVSKFFDKK